jgi:NADPH-dependent curcumin reductase CurA
MTTVNRQITLAARPVGFPKASDFALVETPMPTQEAGQFLVRVVYLSVDPYMRGRMSDAPSYAAPVAIGGVMGGGTVGRVVSSQHADFQPGDFVEGMFGWQEYALSDGKMVRKVDPLAAPLETNLSVLGLTGLTAYFGLLDICDPKPDETVVVSGAAGAVGSIVGQIAKIKGCRVVGIAGSDMKVDYLTNELNFDAAFNYKTVTQYEDELKKLCPKGIDVYFDNVGGAITDAVFRRINPMARVSICGQISQYNLAKPEAGPRLLSILLMRQAKAHGFLVFQFAARYDEARAQLAEWVRSGKIKHREEFINGLPNAPRAFLHMLAGGNLGKQLVKISEP